MSDWTIKAGDSAPVFEDVLTLEDGTVPDYVGATVALVVRNMTSAAPLVLTGTAAFTNPATGAVRFTPSATDTEDRAGQYVGVWAVTLASGAQMSFPTVGYLSITIEDNPVTSAQQLVSLPDLKDYLRISAGDHSLDARLIRYIKAARPVVENVTGPIVVRTYDERHTGGGPTVQIRRRPSSTYGTAPVLTLLTASEDLGASTYPLSIVASPHLGSSYSCMIDSIGTITRLTGGGGQGAFAGGMDSVHITYSAGQSTVPENVALGTLELLRSAYQTTRPSGTGRRSAADDQDPGQRLRFALTDEIEKMLAPNKRAPSVA